jgi:hypothetical protein
VIENMPSVTEIGFVTIDAAFGLEIVLRTVDGSTPGPAVKI